MNDPELIRRKVISVEVDSLLQQISTNKLEILDISLLAIKFNSRSTLFDIGSWCYLKRKSGPKSQRFVQLSSLSKRRKPAISNILYSILLELSAGKTESSLLSELTTFGRFLLWCDNNHKTQVFNCALNARETLISYIQTLKQQVREQALSILTAVSKQNYSIKWLALGLDIDQSRLIEGMSLLKKNMSTVNSAAAPLDTEAEHQLKCYNQILIQITDLLTNFKPLPFLLQMPHQAVWLMPQKKIFATPEMLSKRGEWVWQYRALDYKNGRIHKPEEIKHYYSGGKCLDSAKAGIKGAIKLQQQVNSEPRHFIRVYLFNYAQAAFYNLFLANTGMNSRQVFEMDWSNNFETSKEVQGFKVIKYRAKGMLQQFQITATFLSTFKLFLKLRNFILDNKNYPKLFVSHYNGRSIVQTLRSDYLTQLTRTHLGKLIGKKPITPREWRAYKAVKIMEQSKGDIKLTSELLQNTTTTLKRSYGNVSLKIAISEFYNFFDRLDQRSSKSYKNTPVGGCIDLGKPSSKHPTISPACNIYEHCLFCEKYAFHADKEDVWKVLSMKYIILETQHLAHSIEHFNNLFAEVLLRIDQLIKNALKSHEISNSDVEFIKSQVEQEELSPYWRNKLSLLVDIGVL